MNRKPKLIWNQTPFAQTFVQVNTSRCLFQTRRNYLGNGNRSLQIGDQVWILRGADVPFLLRPLANGSYRLMGDTYAHKVMYGEAVPSEKLKFENIVLR
jgi:hypothetical protein